MKKIIILVIAILLVSCERTVKTKLTKDGESIKYTFHDNMGFYVSESIVNLNDTNSQRKREIAFSWTNK